jgi:predicted molibdopterin-dependent oxidoreductase YjgC
VGNGLGLLPTITGSMATRDFAAIHMMWGAVNELTNDALDPVSRMPEFKVCAVEVTAVPFAGPSAPAGFPALLGPGREAP